MLSSLNLPHLNLFLFLHFFVGLCGLGVLVPTDNFVLDPFKNKNVKSLLSQVIKQQSTESVAQNIICSKESKFKEEEEKNKTKTHNREKNLLVVFILK